jgi:hypothetical protein
MLISSKHLCGSVRIIAIQYNVADFVHSLLTYKRWYQCRILCLKLEKVVAGIKFKAAKCIYCFESSTFDVVW